jgi:hypothetical protein
LLPYFAIIDNKIMAEKCMQSLTFAEFSRKYGIARFTLSKKKDLFQIDPGFDVEKLIDNRFNQELAKQIMSTSQVRPNAKGKLKPRKKL